MTTLKALAAAALLSAMTATPIFAQAAIQEPGAFAFYHPDRDVLNGGIPLSAEVLVPSQAYAAIVSPRHVRRHHTHHAGR